MIRRIFKNTFSISMVTLLIAYIIIVGVLYRYFDKQIKEELKVEAEYIAYGLDSNGLTYFEGFGENDFAAEEVDTSRLNKNRITWIDQEGKVLFDSKVNAENMENHGDREEIISAMQKGEGYVVRHSNTLQEKMVYYAIKLKDNSVLRVSGKYNSVISVLISMLQPTVFLVILIIILSYVMSKGVAKNIVAPINNMDLTYGEMDEEYEELVPLIKRIRKQNILIEQQMDDLRTQQAKFQALTEHMSEGFLVLDKKQTVLSYNVAAVELLGAAKDIDYSGQNIVQFDRNRTIREAIAEALDGYRIQKSLEAGDKIYKILANPIVIEDVVRDETVERQAPTKEKVPKDQIEGVIVIILDETEKEKREQLRREFTSNVSHELKTPLTSISGVAEIMMNGIVKNEDVPGFAKNIYEEAGRLIGLVNDIIFLSKLDEESVKVIPEPVPLKGLSVQVKDRLKMQCREKNVSIHILGEEIEVQGIRSMLEEVLYNLCDNGLKYNREGGKVVITLQQLTEYDAKKVMITVEDTGIGIPLQDTERIFERFYRVDKSHSKAIGGTGLGLSIVKHVVLFHHGEIKAESVLEKGTKITVILPLQFSQEEETE